VTITYTTLYKRVVNYIVLLYSRYSR